METSGEFNQLCNQLFECQCACWAWQGAYATQADRNMQLCTEIEQLRSLVDAQQIRIAHVTKENQRLNLLMGHLNSPTKAEFVATLDRLVTRMLSIDRQAKCVVRQLSHAEYIWHESKATAQRLRLEARQALQEAVEMLNHADPVLDGEDEGPGAPCTPTNPNPWSQRAAIEIGISMHKSVATQAISSQCSSTSGS
ncbi:unnamed protein product, partial [Fusarium fujikuroi]